MNIVHVANLGRNGKLGGLGMAVLQLAAAQRKMGLSSIICSVSYNKGYIDKESCFFTPKLSDFSKVIEGFIPDIVVINGIYEKEDIWIARYLRKNDIPYLTVFHGSASADNASKGWLKKKIANMLFFNKIISSSRGVIYLNKNEYEKSVFKKINDSYSIIPNGVEYPCRVNRCPNEKLINIVFISRLDYFGKGLDVLIPVINRLYDEGWAKVMKFTFYGNSYDNTYKKLLGYGVFVNYLGFVSGEKKEKALESASVNILPSRSEGMPMTILDSLAYGRPCIVTRMTNMAELIEENKCGWVIDLNEESIYHTIIKAVNELSVEKDKYFDNCRNTARLFSWNEVALQSVLTYEKYLKNEKSHIK